MSSQGQGNNSNTTFQYKCARCGHFLDGTTTSKENAETIVTVTCQFGWNNAKNALNGRGLESTPSRYYPHLCLDGGSGIGELVGYKVNGA